jgi:hypothetical protein
VSKANVGTRKIWRNFKLRFFLPSDFGSSFEAGSSGFGWVPFAFKLSAS